jgi:hypothetical protein
MKLILILTSVGLFLAAHGAATAMTFAPLPAMIGCITLSR